MQWFYWTYLVTVWEIVSWLPNLYNTAAMNCWYFCLAPSDCGTADCMQMICSRLYVSERVVIAENCVTIDTWFFAFCYIHSLFEIHNLYYFCLTCIGMHRDHFSRLSCHLCVCHLVTFFSRWHACYVDQLCVDNNQYIFSPH